MGSYSFARGHIFSRWHLLHLQLLILISTLAPLAMRWAILPRITNPVGGYVIHGPHIQRAAGELEAAVSRMGSPTITFTYFGQSSMLALPRYYVDSETRDNVPVDP